MAKHPKGRGRFRRYLRGNINHGLDLGTIGPAVVIGSTVSDVVTERAWTSSVSLRWSLNDWTPITNAGPILVGVAHPDYTDAEIEAWLENSGSWEEADQVQQEVAKRKIRQVGIFENPTGASLSRHLNDGKPILTKCGWMITTGQSIRIWAYNLGSVAAATTTPQLEAVGHANLWPK